MASWLIPILYMLFDDDEKLEIGPVKFGFWGYLAAVMFLFACIFGAVLYL
jgi:heme/copper-type cytochrome/quinol oxidase subunit 3